MIDNFIPVANPKAQIQVHEKGIDKAIKRVLSSGWYILGEEVSLFEQEFSDFLGFLFVLEWQAGRMRCCSPLRPLVLSRVMRF